jgi:hypothetical protein
MTAILIISQLLLHFHNTTRKVEIICNNMGMVKRCPNVSFSSLRSNCTPNTDQFITQHEILSKISTSYQWVKSHSDKAEWETIVDLENQKLMRDEIFNVWCDRLAAAECNSGSIPIDTQEVTSAKQWTFYSIHPTFHKIIGDLGKEITSCLGYESLLSYIDSKHGLAESKLSHTTLTSLGTYLWGQKPHLRANTVKLIHGWNPSYAILSRQGHCQSNLCPRCHLMVETADHFLRCASPIACDARKTLLASFLKSVSNLGTDPMISYIFSYKLATTLDVEFSFPPPSSKLQSPIQVDDHVSHHTSEYPGMG